MRLDPKPIKCDPKNPWNADKLNLKGTGEALTALVHEVEGPLVIGVVAPWGAGKSTFLELWSTDIQNRKKAVVLPYNAWEMDATGDAFLSLLSTLKDQAGNAAGKKQYLEKAIAVGTELANNLVPRLIDMATGLPIASEVASMGADWVNKAISNEQTVKAQIKEFRAALEELGGSVKSESGFPLIIIIDELDRCRPDFSVHTLEVIKHLFNVDNVVFVLGVHADQLAESVRGCYGQGFDGSGYLRRFFNLTVALPEPDLQTFIQHTLGKLDMGDQFRCGVHGQVRHTFSIDLVAALARTYNLSLRDVEHLLAELGIYHLSLKRLKRPLIDLCTWLIALRYHDRSSYEYALKGKPGAEEAWQELDGRGFAQQLNELHEAAYFRWCLEGFFHGEAGLTEMVKQLCEMQSGEEGPPRAEKDWVQALLDTHDVFGPRQFETRMYERLAPHLKMFKVA